jgi:hypothetical protein
MKLLKILTFLLVILLPIILFGQGSNSVEMADDFRREGKIYVVVLGLVIILTGVLIFLVRVDRKIFKLEKKRFNNEQ